MDSPETLGDIAIFAAVVREGSFTRAADKLELSTSQVSKCVNRLERVLGARLLHRTTRRLRLTEAGSALREGGPHPRDVLLALAFIAAVLLRVICS